MAYEKSDKLHIVAVTAAIRNDQGKYLVLKRSENEKAFPGAWCFPGGKVEGNQTIDEAISEEILEETGLKMKPGKVLLTDTSFVRPDEQTVKVFVYLCEVEDGEVQPDTQAFSEARWMSPDEVQSVENVGLEDDILLAEKIIASGVSIEKLTVHSKKKDN